MPKNEWPVDNTDAALSTVETMKKDEEDWEKRIKENEEKIKSIIKKLSFALLIKGYVVWMKDNDRGSKINSLYIQSNGGFDMRFFRWLKEGQGIDVACEGGADDRIFNDISVFDKDDVTIMEISFNY